MLCSGGISTFIMNDPALIPSSNQSPITGDHLITKPSSKAYRSGWDRIWGDKTKPNANQRVEKVINKLGGYYDHKSKEVSPDVPQQSNQTCEDCPQQAKAVDSCSESTCAVRSGLLNRN